MHTVIQIKLPYLCEGRRIRGEDGRGSHAAVRNYNLEKSFSFINKNIYNNK